MEIRGIGQGGQASSEINKILDNTSQVNNSGSSEKTKDGDNKSTDNRNVSEKDLKKAVEKLNKFLEDNRTHAEYQYHDKFKNDLMIKIVDDKTGKTIQEVPPKKVLDMVAKMMEMVGLLVDKRA